MTTWLLIYLFVVHVCSVKMLNSCGIDDFIFFTNVDFYSQCPTVVVHMSSL